MSGSFWRGKCVAVTGGAGFLGREVVQDLRREGAEHVVVPRSTKFDLTRPEDTEQFFLEARPDVVIHLAAEVGGIGANQQNPGRYFFANMSMALNLIETARAFGVQKFVQIGTICSYPKHAAVPFREDDLWSGFPEETNAPYGIAKKAAFVMLDAYREQYSFPGISLLPVNLYGPGDNFDLRTSHVIPAMIRKFVTAKECGLPSVTLWGTGAVSREFLFVRDCARAIVLAAEHYDLPQPVNIGTGSEIEIAELAVTIQELVGYSGRLIWDDRMPDGQPRRCLDTSRARREFGFEAQTDLKAGLQATLSWWLEQGRGLVRGHDFALQKPATFPATVRGDD